jgi:hypothetical protein
MNEFDAPDTNDSSTPRQSSFCVLSTSAHPSMTDFTSSVFGLVCGLDCLVGLDCSGAGCRCVRTLGVEEEAVGGLPHGRLHDVRRPDGALIARAARVARHRLEVLLLRLSHACTARNTR